VTGSGQLHQADVARVAERELRHRHDREGDRAGQETVDGAEDSRPQHFPPPWKENSRAAAARAQTGAVCTPTINIRYLSGIRRARAAPAVPDRRRNSSAGQLPEAAAAERTEAATVKRIDVSELMRTRTTIAKAGSGIR